MVLLMLAGPGMAQVVIERPWVRAAPPVASSLAAYMTLTNTGSTTAHITGATSPLAGQLHFHRMVGQPDGTMGMQALQAIELAPGDSVTLKPGGMHLMLTRLNRVPAAGDQIRICLRISQAEPVCTLFPVQRNGPGNP
ncbi:hypothetical protein A11A3_02732 [Alcanivorax hongdengensis A-11-3]|uniref:Copper chaperone PCu(A)C n=1 Tax=Alcanivorax hongdengensis A-11-3 TaxID=1177179 RepID=L0WGA6_9GAMM|nr:hypothetical protein A11A3_02732 [Alcanivorax hongdengensis A-11-3]